MFLSKIEPLPIQIDHRLIMKGFPDTDIPNPRAHWKILFRIEPDGSTLVQSQIHPNWANVLPKGAVQTREYTIPTLQQGVRLVFRCAVNATMRRDSDKKDIPVSVDDWFQRRQDLGGNFDVKASSVKRLLDRSGRNYVPICLVMAEGIVTVANPDQFADSLANGIGKRRSYGCGLLSVRKIQES